jgi:pyridoxal phosphate enzyme (YggS family)
MIEEAIAAGITCFGENRVQEAQEKWGGSEGLKKKYPHIKLHLIGALQTNKVRQALELFDVIQTLDRVALADAIARHKVLGLRLEGKTFYIQVNTGEEPQKAGILPENADGFISYCVHDLHLPVAGLMCVPPTNQPPAPHFALLREIAKRNNLLQNNLHDLSMGMSDDFETAIRMGATCVRVGSGIFGERK